MDCGLQVTSDGRNMFYPLHLYSGEQDDGPIDDGQYSVAKSIPRRFQGGLQWAQWFATVQQLHACMAHPQSMVWARPILALRATRLRVLSIRAAYAFFARRRSMVEPGRITLPACYTCGVQTCGMCSTTVCLDDGTEEPCGNPVCSECQLQWKFCSSCRGASTFAQPQLGPWPRDVAV